MPSFQDQTKPTGFGWSVNASAKDNLAAVGEAFSPLKRMSDQVKGSTKQLQRQVSNTMFLRFDNPSELLLDEEEHTSTHTDPAAELRQEGEELAKRNNMNRALAAEIAAIVERAKALGSPAHAHHGSGPMPWTSMPTVLSRHGEPQPEVHIGWADIYLDLILVGVAFNGGLLLKHAFYLCHPVHVSYYPEGPDGGTIGWEDGRMLGGHGDHPPCVGLFVGVIHALAFATPLLSAWAKETIFDAQFDAASLFSRGVEVLCYLMMVIGASCSEDVHILESDNTFWIGLCSSMLVIDFMAHIRYGQIAMGHDEEVARHAAWQRIGLLATGTVLYLFALLCAVFFIPGVGDDSHGHFVPLLIILAASAPLLLEVILFAFTSYQRALPYNAAYSTRSRKPH